MAPNGTTIHFDCCESIHTTAGKCTCSCHVPSATTFQNDYLEEFDELQLLKDENTKLKKENQRLQQEVLSLRNKRR